MRQNFDYDEEIDQRNSNSDEWAMPSYERNNDEYGYGYSESTRIHRIDHRSSQQLSGFVFCCVGSIILFFGIWLCQKANNSHRTEELLDYVADVANWEKSEGFRARF